jgi:hypothetical protein
MADLLPVNEDNYESQRNTRLKGTTDGQGVVTPSISDTALDATITNGIVVPPTMVNVAIQTLQTNYNGTQMMTPLTDGQQLMKFSLPVTVASDQVDDRARIRDRIQEEQHLMAFNASMALMAKFHGEQRYSSDRHGYSGRAGTAR